MLTVVNENNSLTEIDRYIRMSISSGKDPDIIDLAVALRRCVAAIDYYEQNATCKLFDWSKEYVIHK